VSSINWRVLWAVTLVHFTGDFYSSFTGPLFPLFAEKLSLSLAQIGLIAGAGRFLAFIVQPPMGYLADRSHSRVYILGGLLLTVVFVPLTGIAASFHWLLAFVCLGSIGSSMFHPSLAGMVPLYAGQRTGLAMSVFNTGGTLAFGVGPLFITAWAVARGLETVPWTMLLGVAVWLYLLWVVPPPQSEGLRSLGFWGALRNSLGKVWRAVVLIWLVMVLRAVTGQAFLTFMPILMVQRGHTLVAAGTMYAIFTVAGTLSGILVGHLSDRMGYRPLFLVCHALMTPALLSLLWFPGRWVFAGAALAGALVMATLPLGVVMAQRLAPQGRSMVSSLMMGLAYGLGGALSPLIGLLADRFGIDKVLMWVTLLPLGTLLLIRRFPRALLPGDRSEA
jgi:FSR family fosmidomycin resistance protein-like MFS transporter